MNTEKLAHWLTIVGNLGLLAGLILVALQINQNTELARTEMGSRDREYGMQFALAMMGENPAGAWSKASMDPESLTDQEIATIGFLVDFWWNFHDRRDYLEQNGLILEDWTDGLDYHAVHTYGGSRPAAATWRYWLQSPNSGGLSDWVKVVEERFPQDSAGNAKLIAAVRQELERPVD